MKLTWKILLLVLITQNAYGQDPEGIAKEEFEAFLIEMGIQPLDLTDDDFFLCTPAARAYLIHHDNRSILSYPDSEFELNTSIEGNHFLALQRDHLRYVFNEKGDYDVINECGFDVAERGPALGLSIIGSLEFLLMAAAVADKSERGIQITEFLKKFVEGKDLMIQMWLHEMGHTFGKR